MFSTHIKTKKKEFKIFRKWANLIGVQGELTLPQLLSIFTHIFVLGTTIHQSWQTLSRCCGNHCTANPLLNFPLLLLANFTISIVCCFITMSRNFRYLFPNPNLKLKYSVWVQIALKFPQKYQSGMSKSFLNPYVEFIKKNSFSLNGVPPCPEPYACFQNFFWKKINFSFSDLPCGAVPPGSARRVPFWQDGRGPGHPPRSQGSSPSPLSLLDVSQNPDQGPRRPAPPLRPVGRTAHGAPPGSGSPPELAGPGWPRKGPTRASGLPLAPWFFFAGLYRRRGVGR